jgi:putative transposase
VAVAKWVEREGITLGSIEPASRYRTDSMNNSTAAFGRGSSTCTSSGLTEVREQAELWLADCSREIPRDSFGEMNPAEFGRQNDPGALGCPWY